MSREKDRRALQEALPPGVVLTHAFRAGPPLRTQLVQIVGGVLLMLLLRRGPQTYLVGIAPDALVVIPSRRPRNAPAVRPLLRADLTQLTVKRGVLRTKITIATATEQYQLRVGNAIAWGKTRAALTALDEVARTVTPPASVASTARVVVQGEPSAPPTSLEPPAASAGAQAPLLRIVRGANEGRSFTLSGLVVTIGRHPSNDIVLPDGGVSKYHARVECDQEGRCRVVDLGSTNGTRVNRAAVTEPCLLQENDIIWCNTTALRFETIGASIA